MAKLLMHCCCAPCTVAVYDTIKEKNEYEITAFWYNNNIHPKVEYEQRLETLKTYSNMENINLIVVESYDMINFIDHVVKNDIKEFGKRCVYCYTKRLEETFKYAKQNGYDAVTTTLLISPYQNHELIKKIAEDLAIKYNIKLIYEDFRPLFRQGQNKARELGLYRQKFCGCIYSIDQGKWR